MITVDKPANDATPLETVFEGVDSTQNRPVVRGPRRWTLLNGRTPPASPTSRRCSGLGPNGLRVDNAASCVVACVNTQRPWRPTPPRCAEGLAGVAQLHDLIGQHLGEDHTDQVAIGIETDRGPWVMALIAAGYRVFAINPLQVARYSGRASGAKTDAADAHVLADMVRTDSHQLHQVRRVLV